MPYLYDDEDNAPMTEEAYQKAHDHDCGNCRHKIHGQCEVWECRFAPKYRLDSEGRLIDDR